MGFRGSVLLPPRELFLMDRAEDDVLLFAVFFNVVNEATAIGKEDTELGLLLTMLLGIVVVVVVLLLLIVFELGCSDWTCT